MFGRTFCTNTVSLSLAFAVGALCVERSRAADGPFVLVDAGRPAAAIVLADKATPIAQEAATALQKIVQQMSGALLSIERESEFKGQPHPILVGPSDLARKAGVDVKQDFREGDHYVVGVEAERICLVGNEAGGLRSTTYAVYDLLGRLGCGWYGADALWQVIPKRSTLAAEPVRADERPAFLDRVMSSLNHADPAMLDAWRLGGWRIAQSHALDYLVPREKYEKDHPDWFGAKQPCLTHPEVIDMVTSRFRADLDRSNNLVTFSLSANDSLGFCRCKRCLAVGNASALNLHFANAIARNLAKTHPDRFLLTFYGFWGTHDAPFPSAKAEPGVCVMQVNEGNHIRPWDDPEQPDISEVIGRNNTRELIAFNGWKGTGAILGIYEWWIPTCNHEVWKNTPWYSGETAMRNLRFWKREGVRFVTYQTGDVGWTGLPIYWPLFHVGARGMWNPDLTARQIMTEACTKLYGAAAEPMRKFYEAIEQAMADCKLLVISWRLPSPERVYTLEVEKKATGFLKEAESLNVDAEVRARIAHEIAMWENAKATMARLRIKPEAAQPSKQNPGL